MSCAAADDPLSGLRPSQKGRQEEAEAEIRGGGTDLVLELLREGKRVSLIVSSGRSRGVRFHGRRLDDAQTAARDIAVADMEGNEAAAREEERTVYNNA